MKYPELQKLIKELTLINSKYENIVKSTGANYNIFQVLRIEKKEVTTHSRMIADLLNPEGSHGMGSQLLSLFFEKLGIEKPPNLENVVCSVEKNYGPINNEKITGGNIDIILEGGGLEKPLVIENKIYAGDQDKQLLRYHNQLDGKCDLYYLTLFGDNPSKDSTGGKISVNLISYKQDILQWLETCYLLTIDRPLLRETLKQYINIVKTLTGQSMNDKMNKEIFNLLEKNKEELAEVYNQTNNFVNNHLNPLIGNIGQEIKKDKKLMESVSVHERVHKGNNFCHFKFGNEEKGVVFELSFQAPKLSLWTNGWRWDGGDDTYGTDCKLIEALNTVDRYERPLDSRLSVKDLAEKVIQGIEASRKYYETL